MLKWFEGALKRIRNGIELWFRQFTIYGRLITVMLITSIVPMIVIGAIGMMLVYNSIKVNYIDSINTTNAILADNLTNYVKTIENFSKQLNKLPVISDGIQKSQNMTESEKVQFEETITQLLSQNYLLMMMASEVAIINGSGESIYQNGELYLSSYFVQKQLQSYQSESGYLHIKPFNAYGSQYVSVMTKLFTSEESENNYFIFMAIEESKLIEIIEKGVFNGVSSILVVDVEGDVIASVGNDGIAEARNFSKNRYLQKEFVGSETIGNYLFNYHFMEDNNWFIIATSPSAYVFNEAVAIWKSIISGIIIMTLFVSVVSYFLWQSIVRPLYRLIHTMKSINNVNTLALQKEDGDDEMTYLYKEFNIMIQYIRNLIDDMKEANENERLLELKMLQAQINPHFLFNTLNSIKWMADMSNIKTISHTIGALIRLLRATIIHTNECVTIEQELLNVEDYITIQKSRYGDCFEFTLDVEAKCNDYKIIKFILQPIVENALLHGMDHREDLKITIKVRDMLDHIYIYVEDNGVGFDVDKVLAKKAMEKLDGKLSSIGLVNVMDRVKLFYESKGDIKIISKVNEGSVFILKIPKQ